MPSVAWVKAAPSISAAANMYPPAIAQANPGTDQKAAYRARFAEAEREMKI